MDTALVPNTRKTCEKYALGKTVGPVILLSHAPAQVESMNGMDCDDGGRWEME